MGKAFFISPEKQSCKVKKWMDLVVSGGRIPQTMLTRGHQANNGEDIQETTLRPLEKDEASTRRPGRGQEPSRDPSERGLSWAPAFLNRWRSMALKGAGWHGSSSRLWQKAIPGFPMQGRGVEVPSGGGGRSGLVGSRPAMGEALGISCGPLVRPTLSLNAPQDVAISPGRKLIAGSAETRKFVPPIQMWQPRPPKVTVFGR